MHQVVFFMFILICMGMIHSYAFHGHDQESYLTKFLQLQRKMKYQPWSKPDVGALDFASVGKMEDDLIHGLPGQPSTVNFKQYAGYVTVDVLKGRELFYYFAEVDQDNPSSKPLILWLNGGPGCSSIGVGAMTENGPFGVRNDGRTLYKRQYSWNRVANMLFLESPAGVGFSYSNTSSDYNTTGDSRTARDSFTFLLTWLKRFPHYKLVDFYIMGESYAGYYIPELADVIIHHNLRADPDDIIHLKGIMIGNAYTNTKTDLQGIYDYMWSHSLISDETHHGLVENCLEPQTLQCPLYANTIHNETGGIYVYDIYSESCSNSSSSKLKCDRGIDPCEREYVNAYLNFHPVQKALHVNATGLTPWSFCRPFRWNDTPASMFPIYKRLFAAGLRILLYSGDDDAVIPAMSTRYTINAMNLTIKRPWRPWLDDVAEVAGYRVEYEGLNFSTVQGAGHEVPRVQPRRAFMLVKNFLES